MHSRRFPGRFIVVAMGALCCDSDVARRLRQSTTGHSAHAPPLAEIRTSDVDLFYGIYDAAGGAPSADALERGYIDAGSEGVRQFIPSRIKSAEALAKTIADNRAVYDKARACMAALPAVRARLANVFKKLAAIDPDAIFPPITVLIGRNNSGGTTGKSGVLIGLEVVCRRTGCSRASRIVSSISSRMNTRTCSSFPRAAKTPCPTQSSSNRWWRASPN